MFEDPEIAQRVLRVFLGINGEMDSAIVAIQDKCSPDELKHFKRGVGYVMCEVFEKIVEPICERHPSLRPPEMDA